VGKQVYMARSKVLQDEGIYRYDRAYPPSQSIRPAIPVTYDAEFVELP
jgi:hypothetical protein